MPAGCSFRPGPVQSPESQPFGSFAYAIFLTPNLPASLLKLLMMPLLMTVEMTNRTGFFAPFFTPSHALPIAFLPARNAFGRVVFTARASGSNATFLMDRQPPLIFQLIAFQTDVTVDRSALNRECT